MIKAITFDLDGVYFPHGKDNFIQELRKLGVSESEAKRVFLESDEMSKLYKTGKMTDYEFWIWAAAEWNLNKTPEELIDLLIESYDVDPQVVDLILKIRTNGYKTLVCSNNFPARVNGLQKRFGFLDNFDVAVMAYEVGETKPSPKIFAELIKKSGVEPSEIVFADDKEANINGARDVGITAFHYQDFDQFIEKLEKLGVKI